MGETEERGSGAGGVGLYAGGDTGWVGCGVCWGMLSSGPAAQSGAAGCSEPSLARALSHTRVLTGWTAAAVDARGQRGSREAGDWWEAGERREAGTGLERDTRRVMVWAGWRVSGGWRREALTAMLACAAGRTDAAHLSLIYLPRGGG